jgi:hypothetical protein
MRFGIFLGFLIGAAIASLLGSAERAELGAESGGGLIDKLKRQADEARAAARAASEEKQAEMLRDWERTRHHESTDH